MSQHLDAITFDFWNTLVYEERGHLRGRRIGAWAGILEEAGASVRREHLETAFDASWNAYVEAWAANRQYWAEHAVHDILRTLRLNPPKEIQAALLDAFRRAPEGADLHLAEAVEGSLRILKGAGLRLGIVCDVGMSPSPQLRDFLGRRGVLELFDHWSFSDEVGAYKPSARIFEHALSGLGRPDPARVAHVGDLRRTDVAGALAMGMVAVRYTGIFDDTSDDQPEAHHVILHHADLPPVLGVV